MNFQTLFWMLCCIAVGINGYAHYRPEQVHLSLGENYRDIVVTWSTSQPTKDSIVKYAKFGVATPLDQLDFVAEGTENLFVDGGEKKRSQYIHRVTLSNLKPNSIYRYKCGGAKGYSPIFGFKTFPDGDDWAPQLAIYGDMGYIKAKSLPQLTKETQNGTYDAIIHLGDFAYNMDTNDGINGDDFMNDIEPIAAYVPYMVAPGNHERAYNFSHYKERFTMPGHTQGLYYSYNIGPIHVISYSSEVYFGKNEEDPGPQRQYEWLKKDLKNATTNRAKQPWIFAVAHRPMYCTLNIDDCYHMVSKVRVGIPNDKGENEWGLEKLFYDYGVDIQFYGHEHVYERFFPVYDGTVYNGSVQEPYVNPKAPIHMLSGAAGCYEGLYYFNETKPDYAAFQSSDFGYSRVKVFNASHLRLEQLSIRQGKVIDSFWLVKDTHPKYKI